MWTEVRDGMRTDIKANGKSLEEALREETTGAESQKEALRK